MSGLLAPVTRLLDRFLSRPRPPELRVGPDGPSGDVTVPREGDGVWELIPVDGRHCLTPAEASHYIYFVLPAGFREQVRGGAWVEVEYRGEDFGRFRLQYASSDPLAPEGGLYKNAEQLWTGETPGDERFRTSLFPLPDFDGARCQNQGASFRIEFREDARIFGLRVLSEEPAEIGSYPSVAPLPELKKLPGRFYPINYLFIEITNACNFKCTWCPDAIMDRRRGFMKKEKVFALLEEIAAKKSWLGPLYPVKLHQMGEPFLHPDLVSIVRRAEELGVGIELNTNCGHITQPIVDELYRAGLTNLILSYQTPDAESFKTRKAPRTRFEDYREKVRLAVERKVALGATTNIEIDVMNTKRAGDFDIVSQDDQARDLMQDWVTFCQTLERRYGLAPRSHDLEAIGAERYLDQDENSGRYTLLEGVHLIWKQCHSWGNVLGSQGEGADQETYCPAPYEQFVIQWNGDAVNCCIDYEGQTKVANVFKDSLESVWTGAVLTQRKRDMLGGRLLDVCAKCLGVK